MSSIPTPTLFDIIPAKYRRLVYSLTTLALFLYGLWEASQGDVKAFLVSVATAIVTALASANTTPVGTEAASIEDPEDDANSPVDEDVADVLDPQFPNDSADLDDIDDEFPNTETLYQPGEKEGERFGGLPTGGGLVAETPVLGAEEGENMGRYYGDTEHRLTPEGGEVVSGNDPQAQRPE